MFRVDIQEGSGEPVKFCLATFGEMGMVVPCHDPLIYKLGRLVLWFWQEPDRVYDHYVRGGRWGNNRWYGSSTGALVGNSSLPSEFYFNSARDATLFKLVWGGNAPGKD